MPRLHTREQFYLPVFPAIQELDENNGVVTRTIDDISSIDPDRRITLARLAGIYGSALGPMEGAEADYDHLLDVAENEFRIATPAAIETGLYIAQSDPRFRDEKTECLVRIGCFRQRNVHGVVFPPEDFRRIARFPRPLAEAAMAKTRESNKHNPDRVEADGRVGRAPAHVLVEKVAYMRALDGSLEDKRRRVLVPLFGQTSSTWRANFKAKNLDRLRKEFDEEVHDLLEIASLNLDIGTTALKGAHRAIASNLYRRGSSTELNRQWRTYLNLTRRYVQERRRKIKVSIEESEVALASFRPFLEAKAASEAAEAA